MRHIYYFFAIVAIMWEMGVLKETRRAIDAWDKIKDKSQSDRDVHEKLLVFLMLLYSIWVLVGLFTSQWILFLLFLLLQLLPKRIVWTRRIDAILSIIILIFILLNSYHFHIDIFSAIKSIL